MAIIGALPSTLTNGTTADATQVMADLNFIASQTNANAAGLAGGNTFSGAQIVPASGGRTQTAQTAQVQDNAYSWCSTAGGTKNALTLTPSPAITGYADGQSFIFRSGSTASDAAVTVAISGLGTEAIQSGYQALIGGEIAANSLYRITRSAGAWQLENVSLVVTTSNAWTGNNTFIDNNLQIIGSSDATKKARLEVDGLTTATTRVLTVQDKNITIAGIDDIQGFGSVIRSTSKNNSGTPLTQWDLSASRLVLRNPTSGLLFLVSAPATKTIDITTSNAPGGRDQSGVFSASSWIHAYWIRKDDGTLNAVASASGPDTGPNLGGGNFAGYTQWVYDSSIRLNASTQMLNQYCIGSRMYWQNRANSALLTAGAATSETALTTTLNTLIPDGVAEEYQILGNGTVQLNSGGATGQVQLYVASGVIHAIPLFLSDLLQTGGQTTQDGAGISATLPATGYLAYAWAGVSGTPSVSFSVTSFKIPNGG